MLVYKAYERYSNTSTMMRCLERLQVSHPVSKKLTPVLFTASRPAGAPWLAKAAFLALLRGFVSFAFLSFSGSAPSPGGTSEAGINTMPEKQPQKWLLRGCKAFAMSADAL